jgi:hypothetical protein
MENLGKIVLFHSTDRFFHSFHIHNLQQLTHFKVHTGTVDYNIVKDRLEHQEQRGT